MAFANPELLFFLLLLAIPIAIHLFNFKRYRQFYFTNLRFLNDIKNETKKQSTLKRYLVLATRLLLITTVVFIFAQPYFPNEKESVDPTKGNCVSIYVDNSFSMEGEVSEGVALEIAKLQAHQIVESYGIADRFQIITNEFSGYQQRAYSRTEALDMIDEIEVSSYSRQLDKIFERQAFVLNTANAENRISYLISDFQRGMIPNVGVVVDTLTNYNLVRVNADKVDNVYIDSCWFSSPVHNLFNVVNINVKVVNNSDEPREQMPLKMYVNGEQRAMTNCDIEANGERVVTISYNERTPGVKSCYLELTDYPIVYDDKLYFSYNVIDKFDVVAITEGASNKYLEAAFGQDSAFNYVSYDVKREIDYERVLNSNVVILDGVELSSGLIGELNKFVDNDGTLVVFPSKDMNVEQYNKLLKMLNAGEYRNSGQGGVVSGFLKGENKVTDIAFNSQVYKSVFNTKPEKMDLPLVNAWYKIETSTQSPGEPLLKMINGDAFLMGFKNNVYLFSTPLSSEYSTFPVHSIFIPTIFNIAINSVPQNSLYYVYGADNMHNITDSRLIRSKEVIKLRGYDGGAEFIPQQRDVMGKKTISFAELDIPVGDYIIKLDGESIDGVAINYDRKESTVDFYTDEELSAITPKVLQITNGAKPFNNGAALIIHDSSFTTVLVILALLLLLIESLIIRFMK